MTILLFASRLALFKAFRIEDGAVRAVPWERLIADLHVRRLHFEGGPDRREKIRKLIKEEEFGMSTTVREGETVRNGRNAAADDPDNVT